MLQHQGNVSAILLLTVSSSAHTLRLRERKLKARFSLTGGLFLMQSSDIHFLFLCVNTESHRTGVAFNFYEW